jgi:hypothetical protein
MPHKTLILALLALLLSVVGVLTGCQSPTVHVHVPSGSGGAQLTRNNCYSLLHQLLDEQKDVSMLRFIKEEHSDIKTLTKKIAATSKAGSKLLEQFASRDPSITLDDIRLPLGEAATRDAIAATKKHELLSQTGAEFELTLLLSQSEALTYASNLAKVAAENDSQPDRARAAAGIGEDMKNLNQEVFALLLSKSKFPAVSTRDAKI